MSMSDPIADLLTRMRNAIMAKHTETSVPASRMKEEICAVLKREGFIQDYAVEASDGAHKTLRIRLKYMPDKTPVLQGARRVSKPSLRIYAQSDEVKPVRSGLGISILTTSKGVITGQEARTQHVGGEVICEVW